MNTALSFLVQILYGAGMFASGMYFAGWWDVALQMCRVMVHQLQGPMQ